MVTMTLPLESPKDQAMQALRKAVLSGCSMGHIHLLELDAWKNGASFVECDSLIASALHAMKAKSKKSHDKAAA